LTVSREIDSPEVTRILLAGLPTLPTSRQTQVMQALEDRGDPTAQDALLQSTRSSDVELRAAALLALGRSGGASALPALLEAATDPNAEIVAAAQQAMVALPGDDANVAIVAALADADDALRRFLIDVIGRRRIASAGAELLPLVNDPDQATRVAALRALGQVIEASQLPVLTARLLTPTSDEERQAVQDSLRAACRRTADKDGCARQIQSCLNESDLDTMTFLIDLLGTVGGSQALESVAPLARHNEDAIQDAATRVLGQWRTPDVAPVLIELAQSAPQHKYRIRALRGYLRVIRQMDVADADKLVMVRQALQAATRPEERRLAVETLGRIPTAEALEETIHYLSEADLRAASCAAAVAIAEKIVNDQPAAVASPMRQVLAVSEEPDITRRAEAVLTEVQPRD
jgi:HEAT repeat protein